ncbi:MAG: OmpA family protein [Deltaproteobacteria bacterium]|jgi:outer membrane protein OmpA-like peptidoglycan-associated protein
MTFKVIAIGALALLLVDAEAEACGLKLSVKATQVNKPIPPSKNPSRILLVGDSSKKMEKILGRAGHKVDTVDSLSGAKNSGYGVVMVDEPSKVREAETIFTNSKVVSVRSRPRASLASVEQALAGDRPVLAAAPSRVAVAAGPTEGDGDRTLVAAGRGAPEAARAVEPVKEAPEPEPEPAPVVARAEPEPEPEPAPEPVKKVAPAPAPKKSEPVKVARATAPKPKAKEVTLAVRTLDVPKSGGERPARAFVNFGFNSNSVGRSGRKALSEIASYLEDHPSASVVLTGHTDSSGPADYNLTLGQRRAEAAQSVLAKIGVSANRIETRSDGENNPVFSPKWSKKNRCVTVEVIE